MMRLTLFLRQHKKSCFVGLLFIPVMAALFITFGLGYRVLINTTHSLPHTCYLTNPWHGSIQRGDFIAFHHNASRALVVKRVVGIEGDGVGRAPHTLFIHGMRLTLKEKRSNGKPLTPLKTSVVPKGVVFVAGDHPDSFDSRYDEFGLVPLNTVRGRVWPLF